MTRRTHGIRDRSLVLLACLALGGVLPAVAQEPPPENYAGLEGRSFVMTTPEVNNYMRAYGFAPENLRDDPTRFMLDYYCRNWDAVRNRFQKMPPDLAERVYGKMLNDLTAGQKPVLTLDDAVAVMDLCPADPAPRQDWIQRLGLLLRSVLLQEELAPLAAALERGTRFAGGQDPAKRMLAGRILMAGGFQDLAPRFLPDAAAAAQMADAPLREQILAFLGAKAEIDKFREGEIKKAWSEDLGILTGDKTDPGRVEQAMVRISQQVGILPPDVVAMIVGQVFDKDAGTAGRLLSLVVTKIWQDVNHSPDGELETRDLRTQVALVELLSQKTDPAQSPWRQLIVSMAENWLRETERMLSERPVYEQQKANPAYKATFVFPDELIAACPRDGAWTRALPQSLAERILLVLPRVQMYSQDPDKAVGMILEIGRQNITGANALAQDFLRRWAELRNPQIPDFVRAKYQLPPGSAVVVTPLMAEKNVEALARIMALLRQGNVQMDDYDKILAAFDMCYGTADAYRRSHIEKVFGPVDDMPERLFYALLRKMGEALGGRWRQMTTQQAAMTNRGQDELLEMIRTGYSEALKMIDSWCARHKDGWLALQAGGTLLNDWGDYEFFQELTRSGPGERMRLYKEKNALAQDYFLRACEAYAGRVPALEEAFYTNGVHVAWFNSLLGLDSNGDINVSKALNPGSLQKIRESIRALPGAAAAAHMALFARHVNARLRDTIQPLPPELRQKYLASALLVIADSPFSADARKQADYYNELLKEVRLQTAIDGPNTIRRTDDFGVIISLVHSDIMGRMLKLDKYLSAQPPPNNRGPIKRMTPEIGARARNDFERNILDALTPFFDVKTVLFSPRDVTPRPAEKTGWQETVLAYVQVRAKDISVDRIPPIDLNLDYFDMGGPVQLPVTSAETLIQLKEDGAAPRLFGNLRVTQTLDARQALSGGNLLLVVSAAGTGLMPGLGDVLDLAPTEAAVSVKKIETGEGPLAKELLSWGDKVQITSERQWTVTLDGTPLRKGPTALKFEFPVARDTNTVVRNERYDNDNVVPVAGSSVKIRGPRAPGSAAGGEDTLLLPPEQPWRLWAGLAGAAAMLALAAVLAVRRARRRKDRGPRARDVFRMPEQVDPFAVIRLLRSLCESDLVKFSADQLERVKQDVRKIESACFNPTGPGLKDEELREIAKHWLKKAC